MTKHFLKKIKDNLKIKNTITSKLEKDTTEGKEAQETSQKSETHSSHTQSSIKY